MHDLKCLERKELTLFMEKGGADLRGKKRELRGIDLGNEESLSATIQRVVNVSNFVVTEKRLTA